MKEIHRTFIPLSNERAPESLCWDGDSLVDWVGGGIRYPLDGGAPQARNVYYPYRFDHAIVSSDGRYQILYERLGTKALILENGKELRELNRSYYFANAYQYPITIFTLNGQHLIAHCPDQYKELQIEELVSGKRLTDRATKAEDFFHSRLQVSPDSRFLMSAGWVWHPSDEVQLYPLAEALVRPPILGEYSSLLDTPAGSAERIFEIHSASFDTGNRLILAGDEEGEAGIRLNVIDLDSMVTISSVSLAAPAGTLMPVGDHVVCFHHHPRLVALRSGEVVAEWPDIASGTQNSSIMNRADIPPAMALDAANQRFAIAGPDGISVVQLGDRG